MDEHSLDVMARAIATLESRIAARSNMFSGKTSRDRALLALLKALHARAEELTYTVGSAVVADAIIRSNIVGWDEAVTLAHEKGLV